ncbi:MAG: YicC family protein [candidate division NC10 bacterium]|nr:YicC family protein [candidate division NC10 bacterium]
MLNSMTGFGRGEHVAPSGRYLCELQSVNHRYLEVRSRLPRRLAGLDLLIQRAVQGRFARGRIDVTLTEELPDGEPRKVRLNRTLAVEYLSAFKALQAELGLPGEVTLEFLCSQRDLFELEGDEVGAPETDWPDIRIALERAMTGLAEMRRDEGKSLEAALLGHLDLVEATVTAIIARAPEVVRNYKNRLEIRLQRLLEGKVVDPGRLEQEVAILADRSDIAEEVARLTSHLGQFREFIGQQGPHGRRMEFLLQEMQREANTIGAKANDAKISQDVVALKSTLEQLREQVQNVE